MKLIVKNFHSIGDKIIVNLITEIGNIKGIWKSQNYPMENKEYSVELSITDCCEPISLLKEYDGATVRLDNDNDNDIACFNGYCEAVDEDVYYIRFGDDWLEMVDIPKDSENIEKGDFVSFSAKYDCILIYPY